MDCYKYVYDKQIIEDFYNVVFRGNFGPFSDEVLFVAASARNKELSKEEREGLGISNHEMYASQICHSKMFENYYKMICRFECNVEAYTGKNGQPLPQKCLGLYATVNPISLIKAFLLKQEMDRKLIETVFTSSDKDDIGIINGMYRSIKLSNAIATKCTSRKNWIDIDVDFEDHVVEPVQISHARDKVKHAIEVLIKEGNKQKFIIVHTKHGCHVLMSTDGLNFNPKIVVAHLLYHGNGMLFKEVEIVNGGVPLPGTLQRGFPVTFNIVEANYEA